MVVMFLDDVPASFPAVLGKSRVLLFLFVCFTGFLEDPAVLVSLLLFVMGIER